ncbi:MAG: ABC transporter permease [Saprospiraceae bacterium]
MFKLNFLLSWRHLLKNRTFSIINVGGLMLGMTVALLIGLWVKDELSFDTFHKNYDHLYKVIANRDFQDFVFTDHNMTFPYARVIDEKIPELEGVVWTSHNQPALLAKGDEALKVRGYSVGGPYFQLFSWTFLQGNAEQALSDPASIVLTESMARALFGDQDAMQQSIRVNNQREVMVSGVVQDPPANSSLDFDYIQPFDYTDPDTRDVVDHWGVYSWDVYVQTAPGADLAQLNRKLTDIMVEQTDSEQSSYFVYPMARWHLYEEFKDGINTGGTIRYVRLFGVIAIIILIIACINFMNLSTARSQKRSMEVAVRKTLGSGRASLIQQFLTESTMVALVAFVGAMIAVAALLPYFDRLVDRSLHFNFWNPIWWLMGLGIILFSGLLAGSYPAFLLSSFKPIKILKGETDRGGQTFAPRRFLVVFQFVATIALISATILVFQQIHYIKNRDIGYDPDNLIMVPTTGTINQNFVSIEAGLLASGLVEAVTRTSSPITDIWARASAPKWPGKSPDTDILFGHLYVGKNFANTMNIDLIEGKDFEGRISDTATLLINRAAAEVMNMEHPVGQQLGGEGHEMTIVGVINDVVMESPFSKVSPLLIFYTEGFFTYVNIRLKTGVQPQTALSEIEAVFKQNNPAYPFEYEFVDEVFGRKLASERLVSQVINIFAGLAVFISCLGLIGLVAYIIEKRMKEIAIRKVLGASQSNLLLLIGKEFLILVVIALLIATPLTYYGINHWLDNYEYQVGISLWVFLLVGGLLLLLTLLIVGIQTVRAALSDPIAAIRLER